MKKPILIPRAPEDEDVIFVWDNFVEACKQGSLIDYDGFGELCTATHGSGQHVTPSDAVSASYKKPEWATHVAWFNR